MGQYFKPPVALTDEQLRRIADVSHYYINYIKPDWAANNTHTANRQPPLPECIRNFLK